MRHHLPDETEEISMFVKLLPFSEYLGIEPFTGLVFNVGVCTVGHRDTLDQKWCVVIPFCDFKGGALVLHEVGLVLEARAGDVIIFPSCDITHFNLHFEGMRVSLVLHVDKHGQRWVVKRNEWTHVQT
jgi:hypothetical protein